MAPENLIFGCFSLFGDQNSRTEIYMIAEIYIMVGDFRKVREVMTRNTYMIWTTLTERFREAAECPHYRLSIKMSVVADNIFGRYIHTNLKTE